jgi:hypothetical protein
MWHEGQALLYEGGHYDRNLFLARLGILPFFWIASLVVYIWAKCSCGEPVAAFSVLSFTFLPPVLAHAGLATTDMALMAMVGCAFLIGLPEKTHTAARLNLEAGGSQLLLELHPRSAVERRVETFLVVHPFQAVLNGRAPAANSRYP